MRSTTLLSFAVLLAQPALAQSQPGAPQPNPPAAAPAGPALPAQARCLVRTYEDATGVERSFVSIATDIDAPKLSARGFRGAPCGAFNLVAYRDRWCKLRMIKNKAVQNRIEHVFGASASELCRSAVGVLSAAAAAKPPG
jgi:hypothetical protein